MKSNKTKILIGMLAIALLGAFAVSQTIKRVHMHHEGMFGDHMLEMMTDYLGLSSDQQAQIKQIMAKEKPAAGKDGKRGQDGPGGTGLPKLEDMHP